MQIVGYDPKFKEAFIEMNKAWIDQVIQHFELSVPSLHPHYRDFLTTTARADFLWQTFFDQWVPSLLLKLYRDSTVHKTSRDKSSVFPRLPT